MGREDPTVRIGAGRGDGRRRPALIVAARALPNGTSTPRRRPSRPSVGRARRAAPVGCDLLAPMTTALASADSAATSPLLVLQQVFGYGAFRGPQQAIVQHAVAGGDALVLMPTGGGKSLCYQVPAIVRHRAGRGVAVVVSPLIALMHDQVGALEEAGVHAAYLNSTLDVDEAQ